MTEWWPRFCMKEYSGKVGNGRGWYGTIKWIKHWRQVLSRVRITDEFVWMWIKIGVCTKTELRSETVWWLVSSFDKIYFDEECINKTIWCLYTLNTFYKMFVVNQSVSGKELYSPEEGGGGGGLGVELGAGAGKVTSRTNSFEIENLLKVTIKNALHFLCMYFFR